MGTRLSWHWVAERWGALRQYRFSWPALDTALLVRSLMLLLLVGAAGWLMYGLVRRLAPTRPAGGERPVGAQG